MLHLCIYPNFWTATAGTPPDYWAVWKEEVPEFSESKLKEIINKPLTESQKEDIFKEKTEFQRKYAEKSWKSGGRLPSPQDHAIASAAYCWRRMYFYTS